nr:DUF2867 domain-containing protein [Vibrio amylolyticus]
MLRSSVDDAYFKDTYSITIANRNQTAFDVYAKVAQTTPAWVIRLMALRNWIVSKMGLKHLGQMNDFSHDLKSEDVNPGDTIGIFNVVANLDNEIVLEDCDKHLDVRLSFLIEPYGEELKVHATTVVHVHNWFGKVYMFFVAPVHRIIVPSSLKGLSH